MLEGVRGYVSIKLSANAADYSFMIVYGSKKYLYGDSHVATDPRSTMSHLDSRQPLRKLLRDRMLAALGARKTLPVNDPHLALIKDFVACGRGKRAEPPVVWQEAFNTLELGLHVGREIQQRKSARKDVKGDHTGGAH